MSDFQTEHPFTLPIGFVDPEGTRHREGRMRLASAADEILPAADPRVARNPGYGAIITLSRVVSLGDLMVTPQVIENLFAADFYFLNRLYDRINALEPPSRAVACPKCSHSFEVEAFDPVGES